MVKQMKAIDAQPKGRTGNFLPMMNAGLFAYAKAKKYYFDIVASVNAGKMPFERASEKIEMLNMLYDNYRLRNNSVPLTLSTSHRNAGNEYSLENYRKNLQVGFEKEYDTVTKENYSKYIAYRRNTSDFTNAELLEMSYNGNFKRPENWPTMEFHTKKLR